MVEFQEKEWVNHIIVASGIIVGFFIIVGFISQIQYFTDETPSSPNNEVVCRNCLSEDDNNYQQTLGASSEVILELSSTIYDEQSVEILENPVGAFQKIGRVSASRNGRWALKFQTLRPGYVDIKVKSTDPAVSDYHTVLVIE